MKQTNIFSLFAIVASLTLLGAGCYTATPSVNQPSVKVVPVEKTIPTPISQPAPANKPAPISRTGVTIASFSFQPNSLTISVGTIVTWTNNDSVPHTISANDGSFDSGVISPGTTFSYTFSTVGNISYHCAIHPSMQGNIVVTQ